MFEQWLTIHQQHQELEKALDSLLAKHGSYLTAYTVLYILNQQSPIKELRIQELSQKLSLSSSATSRLVVKMEQETGHIVRETCEEDKRGLYVVLTKSGEDFLEQVQQAIDALVEASI